MDDTSSRKSVRAKEKAARQADRTRGEVIIAFMSQPTGRSYIWEQLTLCHVFSTSFNRDALAMAFSEGERNYGLRLLDDILQWCPDQFILMMREVNGRDNRSNAEQPRGEDSDRGSEASDFDAAFYNGEAYGDEVYRREVS